MTSTGDPVLSVVIASHDAAGAIRATLARLSAERVDGGAEIIVADSSSDGTPDIVRGFDTVRLLHFDEPLTVPELRGRGIAAARGQVIAILDPFSLVTPGWARELVAAHRRWPHPVIGGAVDLDDAPNRSLRDWALYINEYGMFMPPVAGGAQTIVPGCNVSYKRAALFDGDRPRFEVFWKTFVNDAVAAAGSPLWLSPGVQVSLNKPIPFRAFLASRFDHGRCFAGMRASRWSAARRLLHAAGSPLLPAVLLWRWSRVYWGKRRYRGRLMVTLPLQALLFGMWAAGEAAGYAFGTGTSCRRLFY